MSRFRRQQTPGDNLRDLYSKVQQWVSAALGSSSIDWDDDGDDGESIDITVNDTTVAKYGHDGSKHGFLVPNGGGWRTVQEDAQARADAAEADSKAYTDTKNAAMDSRMDNVESSQADMWGDITSIQSTLNSVKNEVHDARNSFSDLDARLDSLSSRISALEA